MFHRRRGQLREAHREGLVLIVVWNTRYVGLALDDLRSGGMRINPDDVERLSPLLAVPSASATGAQRSSREHQSRLWWPPRESSMETVQAVMCMSHGGRSAKGGAARVPPFPIDNDFSCPEKCGWPRVRAAGPPRGTLTAGGLGNVVQAADFG